MNKLIAQFAASTLSLAGLLYGVAAQATPLAELPLKASVLAKPNVVFGMDDSGSMDWETLLESNSGILWWNGLSAWNTVIGKPLQTSGKTPMVYLFPVGTTAGGAIYGSNSYYGQAVPPTDQFAWLRSPAFNPMYFNPATTYRPWSKAYFDGSLKAAYPNAVPTTASAHPAVGTAPTLDLTADWSSANANFSSNGYRYYVQEGMVLPAGTRVAAGSTISDVCNGGGEQTLTASVTVAAGRACYASIPYFPATYWEAVAACTIGPNCVMGPDGTTFLQRREIKPANYATTAQYTAAIQNFANWFSYYRKRKLMLAGSMGRALENVTGMRMAVVPFNNRQTIAEMFDADSTVSSKSRFAIAGSFYKNAMTSNGTPTHATMLHIGNQIETNGNIVQYACQRNAMFVVTDGFANWPGSFTMPSYSKSTFGSATPHATTFDNSLADIALAYYTRRARTDLTAGQVPLGDPSKTNADLNADLHTNTYAISLGVRGTIWPRIFPDSKNPFSEAPLWPAPVGDDPTMLDDLYHATINGRGQMYLASNAAQLSLSIQAAFDDILNQTATQGGSAVSSVNLDTSDGASLFAGRYNPGGWTGDLTKSTLNPATGLVSADNVWSAAAGINARDWTTRVIFAGNGGTGGTSFSTSVAGAVNPAGVYGADADVINYLRGDRSKEGDTFRRRNGLMGPVVNSTPVFDKASGLVYVTSGEGMLHAVRASNGAEEWAYVPHEALSQIGKTVERGYVYQTKLDATPALGKYSATGRVLVGGMGAAGRSYYAIDVTSPLGLTESQAVGKAMWTFPKAADSANKAVMGYTTGTPQIVRTPSNEYVVLVTSGYDNGQSIGDGRGRVWMLRASDGEVLHTFVTDEGAAGAEAGLAHMTPYPEADGTVRYAFGGDLLGNVWRIDLQDKAMHKVATLKDASGNRQPVTAMPALAGYKGKRLVMVGTGKLLDVSDFGSNAVQSFYVLADSTDNTTIANVRTALVQRTYSRGATPELTGPTLNWSTKRGWFFDLPVGERANTRPLMGYRTVNFATNKVGTNDCSASSQLYVVDVLTGLQSSGMTYASSVISNGANSTGVTVLKRKDGSLGITGDVFEDKGAPVNNPRCTLVGLRYVCKGEDDAVIKPSRNSWREVVR